MFEGLASPWHLIILVFLFVMLFGAKRLPEMARALGQSARILKAETKGLHQEDIEPLSTAPTAGLHEAALTADRELTPLPPARFDIYTGHPLPQDHSQSHSQATISSTGRPSGPATEQPGTR